jgi:hypothetical protein
MRHYVDEFIKKNKERASPFRVSFYFLDQMVDAGGNIQIAVRVNSFLDTELDLIVGTTIQ